MKNNVKIKILILCIAVLLTSTCLTGCFENNNQSEKQQIEGPLMKWVRETGLRIGAGVSSCTIMIDDLFVMYYTGEGIQIAKSSDGLTFENAGIAVQNGEPGSMQEMVSNSAVFELSNGSYRMIYEGRDSNQDRRLFSAFSSDGFNWIKEEGIRFQDDGDGKPGELFTSVPDIIRLDNSDLRMYYTRGISSATALSTDEGVTWEKEGNLDFDRIVIDPDIIRFDDGSYKLFFTSFDEEFGVGPQYVMSASSSNGLSFTIDDGKRLEPDSQNTLLLDPDIIQLADESYRMYYSEMQEDDNIKIHSALSS